MARKWQELITLRKAAGLSQYELAQRLKLNRSTLGNYEMGEREPDFDTTRRMADFFGVSVDQLLGRPGQVRREVEEIPAEWRKMIILAQQDGYSPDQVLQALRLLESVKRQQEAMKRNGREG